MAVKCVGNDKLQELPASNRMFEEAAAQDALQLLADNSALFRLVLAWGRRSRDLIPRFNGETHVICPRLSIRPRERFPPDAVRPWQASDREGHIQSKLRNSLFGRRARLQEGVDTLGELLSRRRSAWSSTAKETKPRKRGCYLDNRHVLYKIRDLTYSMPPYLTCEIGGSR